MKHKSFIFLLLIISVFALQCKKAKYTAEGYITIDCGQPAANHKIQLIWYDYYSYSNDTKILGEGTTDNNGYFNFKFKEGGSRYDDLYLLDISYNSPKCCGGKHELFKGYTNYSDIKWSLNRTTKLIINLKPTTTLTNSDTLFYATDYSELNKPNMIVGPFTNKRLGLRLVADESYPLLQTQIQWAVGINKFYANPKIDSLKYQAYCTDSTVYNLVFP